jgi:hypothetical protein
MKPWMVEAVVAAASLATWALTYGLMLLITRPRHVEPAPATQDLGPEPPAVVSLLANGWEVTEDAVESTLLDLGARKFYEFRQPANDPMQTTIHVTPRSDATLAELTPYERSVYERVTGLAANGLVPLTALTFRDEARAKSWWKTVRGTIVADARARGLSQRRFGPAVLGVLSAVAFAAAVGLAYVVWHIAHRDPHPSSDDSPLGAAIGAGLFAFVILGAFGGRDIGERDTAEGRAVAARWLGLKQFLRGNDGFADLPPASVAVWDRYLGYGAALGATRVSSAVIDMGMGNRHRVWSSFGGTWHRVRVRYPHFWPRYGHPWGKLTFRAILAGLIGTALARYWEPGLDRLSTVDFVHGHLYDTVSTLIGPIGYGLGIVLIVYAAYALIRILIDAFLPKRITGQVLWLRVWRSSGGGENNPSVPWLYYAAIDDGHGDRTRAWGMPADLERGCDTGDTISVTVRRWSRRVVSLEIRQRGSAGFTRSAVDLPEPPANLGTSSASAPAGVGVLAAAIGLSAGAVAATSVLTVDEVSQAFGGRAIAQPTPTLPFGGSQAMFRLDGRSTLMVQVMSGRLVERIFARAERKGQAVPGCGDGAWLDGNRAVARVGGTFVALVLVGPARRNTAPLGQLLTTAVGRIPRQGGPVD